MSAGTSSAPAPTDAAVEASGVAPAPANVAEKAAAGPRKSEYDQLTHWLLLALSLAIVFLAVVMSTNTKDDEQVLVPILNRPLPPLCATKSLLKLDCPGCGLTRCFISLAHGNVAAAWRFNPAGLWFFALVVGQIPYRAVQLWRIRSGRQPLRAGRHSWILWVLLAAMLCQWGVKMALQAQGMWS